MLPKLLSELKRRNFKIVHVVPQGQRPVLPEPIMVASASKEPWPRMLPVASRATTGSSSDALVQATPGEEAASEVPMPRPRPVRRARPAVAKPATVVAMHYLHAPE
jgi:hypothetical protein